MTWKNRKCTVLLAVGLMAAMTGCVGESILTAGSKIAAGQIASLTANEIKILNQAIVDLLAVADPNSPAQPLTDAQAEALSAFFIANDLNTIDDFEMLADSSSTNPESIEGLDDLADAFVGTQTEFDSENVNEQDLDQIFESIFSQL